MDTDKNRKKRIAFAVAFVTAVLAAVKAVADATVFWPLPVLWQQLRGPQRFQFAGGVVLALVMIVLSITYRRQAD